MSTPLQILILEDNPSDRELVLHELRRAGVDFESRHAESEQGFRACLEPAPDVILADYKMPQLGALRALEMLKERGADIPVIVVSGTIGEEVAVECLRLGAVDYLLKDRLGRLGQAVGRALEDKQLRTERKRAGDALQQSEERFRTLFDEALDGICLADAETGLIIEIGRAHV